MITQDRTLTRTRFDFDSHADKYDRWYATPAGMTHDLTQKSDVFRFLDRAESGARLLDIGCGTGHWSRFFATLGYTVAAVDVSSGMVRAARDCHECEVAFQVADASALPFQEGSFDIAAAMAALEFLVDPSKALQEMARCLRNKGRMLIGTLNRSAHLNLQRLAEGREPYASGHLYSPEELRELLRPFGRVRMAASEPDRIFNKQDSGKFDPFSDDGSLDGPFIVAEVR